MVHTRSKSIRLRLAYCTTEYVCLLRFDTSPLVEDVKTGLVSSTKELAKSIRPVRSSASISALALSLAVFLFAEIVLLNLRLLRARSLSPFLLSEILTSFFFLFPTSSETRWSFYLANPSKNAGSLRLLSRYQNHGSHPGAVKTTVSMI